MLKKIIAFALACGVSLSASAGWVQYDFKDAYYDNGQSLEGYFIRNTDNNAISFWNITGANTFLTGSAYGSDSRVLDAYITVPGGPTGFVADSKHHEDFFSMLFLDFGAGATPNTWTVSGVEMRQVINGIDQGSVYYQQIAAGTVELGQIDADILEELEAGLLDWAEVVPEPWSGEVPGEVPEPASLALLAAGACAAAGLRRRARHVAA